MPVYEHNKGKVQFKSDHYSYNDKIENIELVIDDIVDYQKRLYENNHKLKSTCIWMITDKQDIISIYDAIYHIKEIHKTSTYFDTIGNLLGLLFNIDNIKYIFEKYDKVVPKLYSEVLNNILLRNK